MILYKYARKANYYIKQIKKEIDGKYLSPCRRIEKVYPPCEGKFVAMTFDDGPTTMKVSKNDIEGLTGRLLNILNKYNAKGTFDVIGTTKDNYPDEIGQIGKFTWSGVHYDHYPKYNEDGEAGAINKPELIKRIIDEKHEITSHTYSHKLFGPMRAIYGKRIYFNNLNDVVNDLKKLDDYLIKKFNYHIKLSRPPHYIDKIPDGSTSYDAYRIMGYNYMAASFDGAGWLPLENYQLEIDAMINPLKSILKEDKNSLNGKIIFQKDGCNMNLRAPIVDALEKQLSLLTQYGYSIITVSDLIKISPFEDLPNNVKEIDMIRELLEFGYVLGYKNNTFKPNKYVTKNEFYIMSANPDIFKINQKMKYNQMIKLAKEYAINNNLYLKGKNIGNCFIKMLNENQITIDIKKYKNKNKIKRIEVIEIIYSLWEKRNEECNNNRRKIQNVISAN